MRRTSWLTSASTWRSCASAHRLVVRKIEARALRIDQRALLLHVRAEHLAQRRVHQVRGRVVPRSTGARRAVHRGHHAVADAQPAGLELALVAEHLGLDFLRVLDAEAAVGAGELAAVAHLAAGLGVERRAVEHHHRSLAGSDLLDRRSLAVKRRHRAFERERIVAVELGRPAGILHAGGHRELGSGAGALALALHRRLEAGVIDAHVALARDVRGQIDRKAEGVVELEHGLAVEHPVLARERAFEHLHAVFQGLGEALLLGLEHARHALLRLGQLRIGLAHDAREILDQAVEEGLGLAELVAVADGAADDAPQHVAASFIARNHAVDDEEGGRADVVGDDLERIARQILDAGLARRRLDQILEQVDFVVGVHALQHRGDALQSHAGVHRGLRQGVQRARVVAVVLHEHQVPDFDVAVAVRLGRAGRAAGDAGTVIVENLAARAAGAGVAHLPEIVRAAAGLVADARDAVFGHLDFVCPDGVGLVVGLVDSDPQLVLGQFVHRGEQIPGVVDRVALEIVAEGKIAEHLEEGVVARGIADVFQVVVLAAGAHAALRRGGARIRAWFLAQEHILELHHARIGEQQGRIVARHQRTGGHHGVPALGKKFQELTADFC